MQKVPTQTLGSFLQDFVGEGSNESAENNAKNKDAALSSDSLDGAALAGAPAHALSVDIAPGIEASSAAATDVAIKKINNKSLSLAVRPWKDTLQFLSGYQEPVEEIVAAPALATATDVETSTVRVALQLSLAVQPWKNLLAWLSGNGVEEAPAPAAMTESKSQEGYTLESIKTKWPSPSINTNGLNIAGLLEEFLVSDGGNTRS